MTVRWHHNTMGVRNNTTVITHTGQTKGETQNYQMENACCSGRENIHNCRVMPPPRDPDRHKNVALILLRVLLMALEYCFGTKEDIVKFCVIDDGTVRWHVIPYE